MASDAEKKFVDIMARRVMQYAHRFMERNVSVKRARLLRYATVLNLYRDRKLTKAQALEVLRGPLTYDKHGNPAMITDDSRFLDMDIEAVEKEIYGYNILRRNDAGNIV